MSTTSSADNFFDRPQAKSVRFITTPEGVQLPVELASVMDRLGAFTIDFLICIAIAILFSFPLYFISILGVSGNVLSALFNLIVFIVRYTYFVQFELVWRGLTPGKRIIGLRVIDRRGGPLMPSAVVARNLTREFEAFMPLMVLLSAGSLNAGNFGQWLSVAWVLVIGFLPFMNRDRMRGGDLIAGTIVVRMVTRSLAKDIANSEFHYTFTDQHLSAYGKFELQVLEELLRRHGQELSSHMKPGVSAAQAFKASMESKHMINEVTEKIRNKIGWLEPIAPEQQLQFLKDFYTAERAYLERGQLFGMVKADKHQELKRQEVPPTENNHKI
ncbi:MAG: RDD family protein [Alphaproteobacteria bacterium]